MGTKKIPSPEEEAASKVYAEKNGRGKPELYAKSIWFRSALMRATVGKRIGKVGAKTMVSAGVFIVEDHIPLMTKKGKPITDYEINVSRAVVQKAGIMRARPEIREWCCRLPLEIDDEFITPGQVLELMNVAGKLAGAGDWRPEKGGHHGRFSAELEKN